MQVIGLFKAIKQAAQHGFYRIGKAFHFGVSVMRGNHTAALLVYATLFYVIGVTVPTQVDAAPVFGSIGAIVDDTDARSSSGGIVVTNPASLAAGETVYLGVSYRTGAAASWTTPSGWTLVNSIGNAGTESALYCRTADATLVSAGSQQVNGSSAGNTRGWMVRATGASCTVHASSAKYTFSTAEIPTNAATITNNGTFVLISAISNSNNAAAGVTSWPGGGTTRATSNSSFGSNEFGVLVGTNVQTTATTISAGNIDIVDAANNTSLAMITVFDAAATAPTYTSNPAFSSNTTSSIVVTQTSACTDCTAYGILSAASSTPTCTQIKAGNNSGGSAAYKAANGAMTATVAKTLTFSSMTDGTVKYFYGCMNSTAGGDSAVYSALGALYKVPAFTTALTVASATNTAYTSNSKVLDGPGTVDWVACLQGASPPTVSQVEAHTGGCIVNYSTDDATGTQTLTVTGTIRLKYDLYYVGSYGSQHEAAVHTLSAQQLACATGYNCQTLTSVATTGWLDTITSPAVAASDVVEYSQTFSPDGETLTVAADGNFSCTPVSGPTCTAAEKTACYRIWDDSVGNWMTGTASALCSSTRFALVINNPAPVYSPPSVNRVLRVGTAFSIDLCAEATDDDVLTGTNSTTGTGCGTNLRPAGTSFGGTGNCTLSGTLTTACSAMTFDFTATDTAGATGVQANNIEVRAAQETVPDGNGVECGTFDSQIVATYLNPVSTSTISSTVPAGEVISQVQAPGTLLNPGQDVEFVCSSGASAGVSGTSVSGTSVSGTGVSGTGVSGD